MRRPWWSLALLLLTGLMLSACMQTNYRALNAAAESGTTPFSRDVFYQLDDAFYLNPPECVLVLAAANAGIPTQLAQMIEQALALRLSQKIRRVIGPRERRDTERNLALDTLAAVDRRYFAATENCTSYLEWHLTAADDSNVLIWSRKQIGLEVRLARSADDKTLWQAAHTTSRSEGDLPLSLISLPIVAAKATIFSEDADQFPSMIDDVVRRLALTLPNVR